jgi:hypothetical protein
MSVRLKVQEWRNGADGFFLWIEDVQPRIPSARGGFEIFRPEPFQEREIRRALSVQNPFGTIVFCWPRRHSKTLVSALIVLWRFFNWPTQNIKVLANSERQVVSTAFKTVKSIILNTPALRAAIGDPKNITSRRIVFPDLQSEIEAITPNDAAAYGEKVSLAWTTELHAAQDDSTLQILASSVGDSADGLVLIDSTTDGVGGPLHRLEQLSQSGEDPTLFFSRIEYADLDEALRSSPPWIRREWLRSRGKQLLPAIFASQHLNRRSASINALFPPDRIEASREPYPAGIALKDFKEMIGGRKAVVGGGLDRAYGFSLHGDQTVWTAVAKVAGDQEEPEYYILNQKVIGFSSGRGIKKAILADHDRYGLENCNIESFNSQDIAAWAQERKIPVETIHATSTAQVPAFTELHRIVNEGRLHFPKELERLAAEMRTFTYDNSGKSPRFGHAQGFHDDTIYSLAWGVWSLREQELAVYELARIVCQSRSKHAPLCYLRTGGLILPCSEACEAHKRVEAMHLQYRRRKVDSELTLPEFFKAKVKRAGVKVFKAA